MKAVRFHRHGGPDVLVCEAPEPVLPQVLVRIRACELNRIDVWGRRRRPALAHHHLEAGKPFGKIVLEVS